MYTYTNVSVLATGSCYKDILSQGPKKDHNKTPVEIGGIWLEFKRSSSLVQCPAAGVAPQGFRCANYTRNYIFPRYS
jgi:hypothetical protein